MSEREPVSEEMLGAFLDNQLDARERVQVLEALQQDKALSDKLCELRQDMDLVTLAYRHPPYPRAHPAVARRPWPCSPSASAAAGR
jgi:anti-sigma factor RsiW